MSAKKDKTIEVQGQVIEVLPGAKYKVKVELDADNELIVLAVPSGKIRQNYIMIQIGDYVDLQVSEYNLELGRITYRHNKKPKPKAESEETN